jgi:hypothetical protein
MVRAARFMLHYPREAVLPYLFLVIATLSQLAVPRMVRSVIDSVTGGVIARTLLERLPAIPAAIMDQALPKILEFLNLPAGWTLDQLTSHLQDASSSACVGSSPSSRPFGLRRTPRALPSTCATTCMPRSRSCHSPTTTAPTPASS